MSHASRRVAPPSVYSQVPSSPPRLNSLAAPYSSGASRNPSAQYSYSNAGREETIQNVQTGAIGSDFGPYSVSHIFWLSLSPYPSQSHSKSIAQF